MWGTGYGEMKGKGKGYVGMHEPKALPVPIFHWRENVVSRFFRETVALSSKVKGARDSTY